MRIKTSQLLPKKLGLHEWQVENTIRLMEMDEQQSLL